MTEVEPYTVLKREFSHYRVEKPRNTTDYSISVTRGEFISELESYCMSVKQAVKSETGRWEKLKKKRLKKTVLCHIGAFVFGLLFSMAGVGNEFSPFGVAFAASVPKNLTVTAAAGAAAGWFLSIESVSALRYTSAVLAVCVILSALKPFKVLRDNTATPIITTFVCLFVTGLAITFADTVTLIGVLVCFAEGAVGAAAAYVFFVTQSVLSLKNGISMLTSKEATGLAVCVMLLLLSLRNISVFGVYPSHIITQFIILVCAFYAKEAGGAVVGICGGITAGLGGGDMFLLGFYSLGGLLAGVFSSFGRLAAVTVFAFSGVVVAVIAYEDFENTAVIAETLIACTAFIAVSEIFNEKLEGLLKPAITSPIIDTVKSDIFRRLKNASSVTNEICTSLTSVNEALSKSERSDIRTVAKKTRERVCGSCGLYDVCWKEGLSQSRDSFNTLLNMKKEGIYLEYKTVPQHFSAKCIRTENIASSFNKLYGEYKIRQKTENRFKEMNTLVAEQFVNVSALLDSLCEKIDDEVRFDMESAVRIKAAAAGCGFEPLECCCVLNTLDKMTVDLKVKTPAGKAETVALTKQIELITDRGMEIPSAQRLDEYTRFLYREKADYKVIASGVQVCADGEKYSGDTFSTFEDDNGFFYAIICDGMGTGTKAALVSSLAVTLLEKLIKAGFGIEAAVNTVNTALISKNGDECSVTLDLTVIDRFTGHTMFFKCGAADTAVKKNGRIYNVGFSSLPLGILGSVEIGRGTGMLTDENTVVMSSDGVRDEDRVFLQNSLKKFNGGDVRGFTSELCENIRRYQNGKKDDLTVLTLLITKNE